MNLLLLLGVLWCASYLINDFDLLPFYRRFAEMPKKRNANETAHARTTPAETPVEQPSLPIDNKPAADSFDLSTEDSSRLKARATAAISDRLSTFGISGAIESVTACYNRTEELKTAASAQYCYFLDKSGTADVGMFPGEPREPFFNADMPERRLVAALDNIGFATDDQQRIVTRWQAVYQAGP